MKKLLTKTESTQEAIDILLQNSTHENWGYIEESLIMAKFKADLHLKNDLYKELNWPQNKNEYLQYLVELKNWIPLQSTAQVWRATGIIHSQEVYDRLCHFYYLIDQQTGIGKLSESISWFGYFLQSFMENWGDFLNTKESFNNDILTSYLKNSPQYRIQDSLYNGKPNTTWNTFNDFFSRVLNPGLRPIQNPLENATITSPADCTYKHQYSINSNSEIEELTIKQTHNFKNINELLEGSKFSDSFANGTLVHYFLGPYSYHRFHSPVSGLVKESYPIYGLTYLNIDINVKGEFSTSKNSLNGYQFSQSRGVLTIDTRNSPNGDMGIIGVVPIGMSQIASVHMLATPDTVLDKGEEFGYFKFGGSDVVLLFQEGKAPLIDPSENYRHYGDSISTKPKDHQL